jgi:hypothetical protein
MFQRRL